MTFATYGRLVAKPGERDRLAAILIRPSTELEAVGCLLYEVGFNDDDADAVHVIELWESAEAHRASLELESVRAAIAEAMPLFAEAPSGSNFEVVGSPLRGLPA